MPLHRPSASGIRNHDHAVRSPRASLREFTLLLLACLAGTLAGCRLPDRPYVIGSYGSLTPPDLERLAQAGFSVVVGPATSHFLATAQAARLDVLAVPETVPADDRSVAAEHALRFRELDRHPALWAWSIADEPELAHQPPADLRRTRRTLRFAGARKPITATFWNTYLARPYLPFVDALLADRYPIPRLPLADFPKHLQLARLAAGNDRPMYAVIQAFDWSVLERPVTHTPASRPPTLAEIRAMTYLALIHEAQGIFFYTYRSGGWDLAEQPETWDAVGQVVGEIRLFEPLFTASRRESLVAPRQYASTPARNEALDPSVQASLVVVRDGTELVPAGEYIVAVNTLAEAIRWRFRIPAGWGPPVPAFNEPELRVIAADPDGFADLLPPYGVRIYGPVTPCPAPRPKSAR